MLQHITTWFFATLIAFLVFASPVVYYFDKQIKKVKHDNISKGKTFKIRVAED